MICDEIDDDEEDQNSLLYSYWSSRLESSTKLDRPNQVLLPRALIFPALPLSRAWLLPSFGLDLIVHVHLSQPVLLELDLHYLHTELHQSQCQPPGWPQDGQHEELYLGCLVHMCATSWCV